MRPRMYARSPARMSVPATVCSSCEMRPIPTDPHQPTSPIAVITAVPVPSGGCGGAEGSGSGVLLTGGGRPPDGLAVTTVGAVGAGVDLLPQAATHVANNTTKIEHARYRLGMELGGSRRPK